MELISIKEAADMSSMSTSWWRQRVFRKEIEFLKIGRSVRFRKSTVEDYLERCSVPTNKRKNQ